MRAREFIVEYDRGMTLKSWEQKLNIRMANDKSAPDSIDQLMEMIESSDPTRNKIYAQWIVKRYVAGDYNASDLDQVNLRLSDYDSVKKSLTTGKDINQLTYAQLPDIITAGRAQKTAPKFEVIPDTEVLYNGPDGQLAIPKTEEASRALGSGTAWCTAYTSKASMFNEYNSSGKLYTWRAKNGNKFQFYWGKNIQFMNSANKPLSPKDMHFFREINPPTKKLFSKYEDEFLKSNNKNQILALLVALNESQVSWEAGLEIIRSDPELAYNYSKIIGEPFPLGEDAIATNAEYSYYYAEILDQPFPAGEAAIATNAEYSLRYTLMLNNPFPLGEDAIATNAEYSYYYAELFGKPFPAGEPAIATSAKWSFKYARMLGQPFPAGEPAIADNTEYVSDYINRIVIKYGSDTWENVIKDNAKVAVMYANMLGKRFPAGEPAIANDANFRSQYTSNFPEVRLSRKWQELTNATNFSGKFTADELKNMMNRLLKNPDPTLERVIATSAESSYYYASMSQTRFPAGEPAIAKDSTYSYLYAILLGKPFPAGERAIASEPGYANLYDQQFGTNLSQQ